MPILQKKWEKYRFCVFMTKFSVLNYSKANFASFFGFGYSTIVVENSEVKYSSDAKSTSIWIMNIDGSEQVQLTDAKKGFALNPRWSPDGTRLVFQSSKKDKKDADLYVIDVDGNNLTQLTINKSYDGQPYWTTDGYIYFVSDNPSSG